MSDEPEKPARGRPRKIDTDKTLDIALRAYWSADPADVSLNAICQMAGVSKPSLYREFGNEDGLMRAALDRYAEHVLSDIFHTLSKNMPFQDTLDALIAFASQDPKMETGCVFYKMRAGKHRLGPMTRQRIDEIDAAAVAAYGEFLQNRKEIGEWNGDAPIATVARYLVEQIGLALMQRAAGEDPLSIHATLVLAFSVLQRPPKTGPTAAAG
ncbi:MAG: TetR/AcrR family transcriptional regulator [Pseudomonadota bacterium]